jgi:hypothetical protein
MNEITRLQELAGYKVKENDVFKTTGMRRAQARDDAISKGKQFGIGNFYAWLMDKYPKLTLGQVEQKMAQLEREYAQEKAMRKAEPDMVPSVNSAFDDKGEEMKAKGLESIQRIRELAGLITEDEVEKTAVGHVDDEKDMLAKDLYIIGKSAIDIHKLLKSLPGDSDFPHWWQSKVVKSKEYIEGAKNYLESELNMPDEVSVSPEITDDNDPSGVS